MLFNSGIWLGALLWCALAVSAADVPLVGYAWLGSTTGGTLGQQIDVYDFEWLVKACTGDLAKFVIVHGNIVGNGTVDVDSNTSVLGASGSSLTGIGFSINGKENIIIRNLKISKVLATVGSAISIRASTRIWIDHVDLSSDLDHGSDEYGGLLDLTHGVTYTTITSSFFHDSFKGSLVGDSDSNAAEDSVTTVTYALNYWKNIDSRTPVFRAGHGHIFNSFFETNNDGINTRAGAQLLVENNVWSGGSNPLYSINGGFAVARGNDFDGAGINTAPVGNFTAAPYDYTLLATSEVRAKVIADAGQTLTI